MPIRIAPNFCRVTLSHIAVAISKAATAVTAAHRRVVIRGSRMALSSAARLVRGEFRGSSAKIVDNAARPIGASIARPGDQWVASTVLADEPSGSPFALL